jgi:hypothetical protein
MLSYCLYFPELYFYTMFNIRVPIDRRSFEEYSFYLHCYSISVTAKDVANLNNFNVTALVQ